MSRRRDEIQAAVNSSIDDETSSMCTLLFTQIRVILVLDVLQRRFPTIHNFQYSSFIWHEAVISFNLPVGVVDLVSESGCVGHAQIKFNAIFYDNWNAKKICFNHLWATNEWDVPVRVVRMQVVLLIPAHLPESFSCGSAVVRNKVLISVDLPNPLLPNHHSIDYQRINSQSSIKSMNCMIRISFFFIL